MDIKKNLHDADTAHLPAPDVSEADGKKHVSATVNNVHVVVPVWNGMAKDDQVTLVWKGEQTGEYGDFIIITDYIASEKIKPTFQVPSSEIATNHKAHISYIVTPAAGGKGQLSDIYTLLIGEPVLLPAPSVNEATGNTIELVKHPDGVTVTIPVSAHLIEGDVVTLQWTGKNSDGTTNMSETVTGEVVGTALTFHIAASILKADSGSDIKIVYTVVHASGSKETSAVASYTIKGPVSVEGISVNGHTFAPEAGFPTTGFTGAKFEIEINNGNVADYTWTSDASWVSVTNGVVTFTGKGSGSQVTITGTPTSGQGSTIKYSFTLKGWYIKDDKITENWQEAKKYCISQSGYHLPTIEQLTNDTNIDQHNQTRAVGNLWSEWGNNSILSGFHWSSTNNGHGLYLATREDGSLEVGQYNYGNSHVVCRLDL